MDVSDNSTEIWKPYPNFEELYQVSSCGRVRTIRTGRIRKFATTRKGYFTVTLSRYGRTRTFPVHRAVAVAFVGEPPPNHQVNHKDGVKANNRFNNLEWVTCKQNMEHASRMGLMASGVRSGWKKHPEAYSPDRTRGVNNGNALLRDTQVRELLRNFKHATRGEATKWGKRFGVSINTIRSIVHGFAWTHIRA